MKCNSMLFRIALIVGVVVILLAAQTAFAKGGIDDRGHNGKDVITVTVSSANWSDVGVFTTLWNWFFGNEVSTLRPHYPYKNGVDAGMAPKRSCGGENGCIMVTDKP